MPISSSAGRGLSGARALNDPGSSTIDFRLPRVDGLNFWRFAGGLGTGLWMVIGLFSNGYIPMILFGGNKCKNYLFPLQSDGGNKSNIALGKWE
jgi:hypothetical protein